MNTLREIFKSYIADTPEDFLEFWLKNKDTDLNDIPMKSLSGTMKIFDEINASLYNHLKERCKHTNTKQPHDNKEVCLDCWAVRFLHVTERDDYDFGFNTTKTWSDWSYRS
jgi:hypothetical protein